ncbi:MAG: segregation ATPase FtsK/SpoIIIE, family [Patescibacteria group bacterium]|nr:segregation ATPase FtsK/SpoIIIE, family [Patescibacteria group bacterium]
MGRRRKHLPIKLNIKPETLYSLVAILLISCGVLVIVSFSGQGVILATLNNWLIQYFGLATLFLPFIFVSSGLVMFQTKWAWSKPHVLLGALLITFGVMGLLQSGQIGDQTFGNLSRLVTSAGAIVIFAAILFSGVLILSQLSFAEILEWLGKLLDRPEQMPKQEVAEEEEQKGKGFWLPKLSMPFNGKQEIAANAMENESMEADDPNGTAVAMQPQVLPPVAESADEITPQIGGTQGAPMIWEYPPLSLLSDSEGGEADRGDIKKNSDTIEQTLDSFGIRAKVVEHNLGPSVTQYALQITTGTKLSKITGLATDLALALAAPTGQVRIEAPIAGKSLVGVEVPNYSAQYVTLRKVLSSPFMKKHPSKLATALGINVSGQPVIMDIAKMPHVLIAGATGSGKSVAINTFMTSILFRASPAEVKFILVDPKRVELTGYNDIPHLLVPVIVEPKKVVSALKWATKEMDERYKKLAEAGVKNIASYNELAGYVAMPSIVIVIDELADVMLFAPAEVEECITRIAQMARAVGIHLVLATQRPSVDVITGLIKANIPARIAFNVSSMMDSRVILDNPGAEKLLGKGDMLYIPPDQAKPSRIQGTYVSDQEIKSLIDFIKSQGQAPQYEEDITTKYTAASAAGGTSDAAEDRDELFVEAAQFVAAEGKGSSSMIQRRFSVGYNRAARILDQLHAIGMVGPQEGSKPREVYTSKIMEFLRAQEAQG